jgi:NAD(P)-dependent dehydrogenase (short-subunit alcohol dehydrogenase family)
MPVVLADAWARQLEGSDVRVESMHPGWVETPGVARYLPRFRKTTRPLLREVDGGADTAVGLVATRPDSKPGHFWHDRAQRPTAFGWQRAEDPAEVAHVLEQVSAMTGTPNEWVLWVRHRIDCLLHRAPENDEPYRYRAVPSTPVAWSRSTNSAFLPVRSLASSR